MNTYTCNIFRTARKRTNNVVRRKTKESTFDERYSPLQLTQKDNDGIVETKGLYSLWEGVPRKL